jgi:hypothetical protein
LGAVLLATTFSKPVADLSASSLSPRRPVWGWYTRAFHPIGGRKAASSDRDRGLTTDVVLPVAFLAALRARLAQFRSEVTLQGGVRLILKCGEGQYARLLILFISMHCHVAGCARHDEAPASVAAGGPGQAKTSEANRFLAYEHSIYLQADDGQSCLDIRGGTNRVPRRK